MSEPLDPYGRRKELTPHGAACPCQQINKRTTFWAGGMAQKLRVLTALVEDSGSVSNLFFWLPWVLAYTRHTYIHTDSQEIQLLMKI